MRTDARSIFLFSLLLFLAVTGWILWVALQPPPPPPPPKAREPVKLSRFRPLGVIGMISNQFAAQTLIVPLNPFRPTFEAMVRNPESGDLESIVNKDAARERGTDAHAEGNGEQQNADAPGGHDAKGDAGKRAGTGKSGGRGRADDQTDDPAAVKYAFKGLFKRPDGRVAVYVKNSLGQARFLLEGDQLEGCEVIKATEDGIMLRSPDGKITTLARGQGPLALGGK